MRSLGTRGATGQPAALLQLYLQARDEGEARRDLERLLRDHADPIIHAILARKWGAPGGTGSRHTDDQRQQEAEDLHSEIIAHLLARLHVLREGDGAETIGDFSCYVAVTTYRIVDGHLRRKYPRRWSLKNQLRYLLEHQEGLALWTSRDGQRLAGFTAWQDRPVPARPGMLALLRDDPQAFARAASDGEDPRQLSPVGLLEAIFNHASAPVELDDLVTLVVHLWGIKEIGACSEPEPRAGLDQTVDIPDPQASVADQVDQRAYLQHLWSEIRLLPPRQAAALLLNLRDARGRGVIALLPLTGIATLRQIAAALAMAPEQFAAVWNDLPMDDEAIAGQLGATRQQVINLRKSARERLARRMKAAGL